MLSRTQARAVMDAVDHAQLPARIAVRAVVLVGMRRRDWQVLGKRVIGLARTDPDLAEMLPLLEQLAGGPAPGDVVAPSVLPEERSLAGRLVAEHRWEELAALALLTPAPPPRKAPRITIDWENVEYETDPSLASGWATRSLRDTLDPGPGAPVETPLTRAAYPRIDCPGVWRAGVAQQVTIGLDAGFQPLVGGTGPLSVREDDPDLAVTVLVDPQSIDLGGTALSHPLPVTTAQPFPSVVLTMTARSAPGLADERRIGLHVTRAGQPIGFYWRRIRVVYDDDAARTATPPDPPSDMLDLAPLATGTLPDLVLAVYRGDSPETLVWDAFTTTDGLTVPDTERGSGASLENADLARQIRDLATGTQNPLPKLASLHGVGVRIAKALPPAVHDVLSSLVRAERSEPASVLLLTEEAYVPWELSVVEPQPVPNPWRGTSPFLGAQVAISRWPLVPRRPRPTPASELTFQHAAVLTAHYDGVPKWPDLPAAREESKELASRYGMTTVEPLWESVRGCLRGEQDTDWLHVALHGQYDVQGVQDGLVLLNGSPPDLTPEFLTALQVESIAMPRRPFVFLNACQVGAGNQVLGSYAGMSISLLRAGASAVVSALWNVDDRVAAEVARSFYADVLGPDEVPAAEALRRIRARYTEEGIAADPVSCHPTLLAYQFFGHPLLHMSVAPGGSAPETHP